MVLLSLALCDDRDEFDNEKDSTVGDLEGESEGRWGTIADSHHKLSEARVDTSLKCKLNRVSSNHQSKLYFLVRPVETRLIASEVGAMTADVEYEVRCETAGAQPAAVISWWINGNIRLKDFVNEVSENDGGN